MRVFLTGAAGFIGFHTALALLEAGHHVCGFDNLNSYYDPHYKMLRLDILKGYERFSFVKGDIQDAAVLSAAWENFDPTHVIHLAAQAGVRYSIENPHAYVQTNLVGFQNVIELVRKTSPQNFVYASSSSVYGGNKTLPFRESDRVDDPISLYAATKKSNELVARTYGNLFKIKSTGLRFFTVYGPYGRPDMALFSFMRKILAGDAIPVFNRGEMLRDFTYIDDIVAGIIAANTRPTLNAIYNLGRGKQEKLLTMIGLLETSIGRKAQLDLLPMQQGDVEATLADITLARVELGFEPKTSIDVGIPRFVEWYRKVHA